MEKKRNPQEEVIKNEMEILELKIKITKMKKSLNRLNSRDNRR